MPTRLERELAACGSSLEADGQDWVRRYVFGPDFVGFDGHFPGQPMLPALVQLMAGAQCAADACGEPVAPIGAARAKFLRPVLPGEPMTVRVRLADRGSRLHATVSIDVLGERASSFQLTLSC